MSISVQHLTKTYGAQTAVNNISFSIDKGEIVGFLGPNGAGKSTTMKMITGYLQPDSGSIEVAGINNEAEPILSKKKIGYLPEANPLYNEMYIREYLAFTANVHGIKDANEKTERIILTVGLAPEANKKIGQLSKGYKQRVGLAAALIHEPEVLILDEPTSGLDPNQIIEIRNVIKELAKNKTVLFSSHILQEVEAICDRVIIINKGKIVADNMLSELRRSGTAQTAILVVFNEDPDISLLKGIEGVSGATKIPSAGGQSAYRLHTSFPEDVRKRLFQFSTDNNRNIVSLQNEEASLENIFKSLTS